MRPCVTHHHDCDCREQNFRKGMTDAWTIINVLVMNELDAGLNPWPRALQSLERNVEYKPENQTP